MSTARSACLAWVVCLAASVGAYADDLVASVLPLSRSTTAGQTVTAFATVINTSGRTLNNCSVSLPSFNGTVGFQQTDPATNAPVGGANSTFGLAVSASQTLVLSVDPSTTLSPSEESFVFLCDGANPAASLPGLDTLLLSSESTQPSDIVALAATPSQDGVVRLSGTGNAQDFVVATVNVGTGFHGTVSLDTGDAVLPLTMQLCQTDPATSACLAPAGNTVTTSIAAGATPTFAFFVTASAQIPFFPANVRLFVRFTDDAGRTRGETSVALTTAPNVTAQTPSAGGIYSGTYRVTSGSALGRSDTAVVLVSEDGEVRGATLAGGTDVSALISASVTVQSDLTFAANGDIEAATGYTLVNGATLSDLTLSGAVSPRKFLSGLFAIPGETGEFNVSYSAAEYERPSSLAAVSGSWNIRTTAGDLAGQLSVASNGSFNGSNYNGCQYAGNVTLIDSRYNSYRIHLTISNCNQYSGSYEGLGAFFDQYSTNDSFQFVLSGGSYAQTNAITRY